MPIDKGNGGQQRVARVILDLDVPHLDRPFDYSIPPGMAAKVKLGSLVRVKWGHQRFNGWVVEVVESSEHPGTLMPVLRLLSQQPLFTASMLETFRYLALRFASTLSQVLSVAIPPRRAKVESVLPAPLPASEKVLLPGQALTPLTDFYPRAEKILQTAPGTVLPRIVASAVPHQQGKHLLALLAHYSAHQVPLIILLPTLSAARKCYKTLMKKCDSAALGLVDSSLPAGDRYATYLRALRGDLAAVVGTRSAAWTPFSTPAVTIVWDDGNSHYRERRNPQVDVLDVAVARCRWEGYGLIVASYSRSIKAQLLVESEWAAELEPEVGRLRQQIPRIQVVGPETFERDGFGAFATLPGAAYQLVRKSLPDGPVLVQVAGAGRMIIAPCQECGSTAACKFCGERLSVADSDSHPVEVVCVSCARNQPLSPCRECGGELRVMQVGADRVGRELGRSFPHTPVVVSAASTQIHREVSSQPKIVVATSGAEPTVAGNYAAVIISDADVTAYAETLTAGEESLRRWMNAFALAQPQSGGMLCGDVPTELSRAVVMWRAADYARLALEERRQVGFSPVRWMVAIEGESAAVTEVVSTLEQLDLEGWQVVGTVLRPSDPPTGGGTQKLPEPTEPSLFPLAEPTVVRTVISCGPAQVTEMMRELRAQVRARSLLRKKPVRISVNPPDLIDG